MNKLMKQVELGYKTHDEIAEMVDKVIELSADNTPATEMTSEEELFIRKTAEAALTTLNISGEHRDEDVLMAVRNMSEIAFNQEFPDNAASGYDRIYKPLNAVIENWKQETREKEAEQGKE